MNPTNGEAPRTAIPGASEPTLTQIQIGDFIMTQPPTTDQARVEAHCPCGSTLNIQGELTEEDLEALRDFEDEHEDCRDVPLIIDLDPKPEIAPEIVRWQELADRDITVYHDGDIEKYMPFPRPAWAHKGYDHAGYSILNSAYMSTVAHIPLSQSPGVDHGDMWEPAYVSVRALVWGNGVHKITVHKYLPAGKNDEKPAIAISFSVTPAEAVDLAQAILAAVDLIGGVG